MAMQMPSSAGSGRRRGRAGGRAPMAEINVTPMVDVMLVLMIIFMVAAPMLAVGVPLELPDSQANALEQQDNQVTVSITRAGEIYVNDKPVPPGGLGERLANVPRDSNGKQPLVTLRADAGLTHGKVMEVMGELNHEGFTSISVVTNSSDKSP